MLLSPQSFRTKVSGSFYPPSSSGVGTLPTRPDTPSPRRTLRSGTPTQVVEWNDSRGSYLRSRASEADKLQTPSATTKPHSPQAIMLGLAEALADLFPL